MENPTKEKGEQMTQNDDDIASLKTGIDQLNAKTPKEVVDRILELLISFSLPSRASLFDGNKKEAYGHVTSNLPLYSTLSSLQLAKEQLAIAGSQKQIAESQTQIAQQQTAIAEQQRDISKDIHKSVDESTVLTKTIKTLTWAMLILTGVAVIAAIASIVIAVIALNRP
jgi:hypothetical protein